MHSQWVRAVTEPAARDVLLSLARADAHVVAASATQADAKGERLLLLARAFAHPRDARIRFVEDTHKYYLDGKQLPLSVTGFYSAYFGHFDGQAVVARYINNWRHNNKHKYHPFLRALDDMGVPRSRQGDVIRRAWAENGDHQSSLGTSMHRAIELFLNEEDVPPTIEEAVPVGPSAIEGILASEVFNIPAERHAGIIRFAKNGAWGRPPNPPC